MRAEILEVDANRPTVIGPRKRTERLTNFLRSGACSGFSKAIGPRNLYNRAKFKKYNKEKQK